MATKSGDVAQDAVQDGRKAQRSPMADANYIDSLRGELYIAILKRNEEKRRYTLFDQEHIEQHSFPGMSSLILDDDYNGTDLTKIKEVATVEFSRIPNDPEIDGNTLGNLLILLGELYVCLVSFARIVWLHRYRLIAHSIMHHAIITQSSSQKQADGMACRDDILCMTPPPEC